MTQFCPKCGRKNPLGNQYCVACGTTLQMSDEDARDDGDTPDDDDEDTLAGDEEPIRPAQVPTLLYVLTGVVSLVLVLAAFLPWVSVSTLGSQGSMDGMGDATGILAALAQRGSAGTVHDGIFLVIMAGITALIAFGSAYLRSGGTPGWAAVLLFLGIVGAVLMGYEWSDVNTRVSSLYQGYQGTAGATAALFISAAIGPGIYLGEIGAVAVIALSLTILITDRFPRA